MVGGGGGAGQDFSWAGMSKFSAGGGDSPYSPSNENPEIRNPVSKKCKLNLNYDLWGFAYLHFVPFTTVYQAKAEVKTFR